VRHIYQSLCHPSNFYRAFMIFISSLPTRNVPHACIDSVPTVRVCANYITRERRDFFSMYYTSEDQCLSKMCQDVTSWLDTIREDDLCDSEGDITDMDHSIYDTFLTSVQLLYNFNIFLKIKKIKIKIDHLINRTHL